MARFLSLSHICLYIVLFVHAHSTMQGDTKALVAEHIFSLIRRRGYYCPVLFSILAMIPSGMDMLDVIKAASTAELAERNSSAQLSLESL